MNAAAKHVRKHVSKSTVPRSSVDILRIRVICNSLDALVGPEGHILAETEYAALAKFLKTEIVQLYKRIENVYGVSLQTKTDDATVKLGLLKEDHARLSRLAADAAIAIEAAMNASGAITDPAGNEGALEHVRRFLAAQRHQLIWYKLHIEQTSG